MKTIPGIAINVVLSLLLTGCGLGHHDDIEYAVLGASESAGVGASPITHGFVYLVEDGIENAGLSTALNNYAVPDIESGGILDIEIKALDLGPTTDIITLFTGANDIIAGTEAARFEKNIDGILTHLEKINGVKVFVANIPNLVELPRFRNHADSDVTVERLNQFNQIIARQVASHRAHLVDLAGEPPDDSLVSDDGLHPNNEGHKRIAELFLQEIIPLLPAE